VSEVDGGAGQFHRGRMQTCLETRRASRRKGVGSTATSAHDKAQRAKDDAEVKRNVSARADRFREVVAFLRTPESAANGADTSSIF